MRLAGRGDLMQRAARQAIAEHAIDCRNTERKSPRAVFEPGGLFQSLQALA